MKCIAVVLCLMFAPAASGQVVFVGKQPDKDWCYKAETIRPNLVLSESVHILGRIFIAAAGLTPDTASLNNSRVELRKYISQRKQTTVKVITTDDRGYFDMGTVEGGWSTLNATGRSWVPHPFGVWFIKGCGV